MIDYIVITIGCYIWLYIIVRSFFEWKNAGRAHHIELCVRKCLNLIRADDQAFRDYIIYHQDTIIKTCIDHFNPWIDMPDDISTEHSYKDNNSIQLKLVNTIISIELFYKNNSVHLKLMNSILTIWIIIDPRKESPQLMYNEIYLRRYT